MSIIHRDIKTSNILLDDRLTAKVSDFGASRGIAIDQLGVTIAIQGTYGYLDPEYYYTGRLTEKSDVYSFGVMLLELLTRKKPFSYVSLEGDGLVVHFVYLFAKGNLLEILDPQVMEEGGKVVNEVAILAVACVKLRGEDRPTMRQVEMALEALQAPKERDMGDLPIEKDDRKYVAVGYAATIRGTNLQEASRRHSLEEEFILSARYPR